MYVSMGHMIGLPLGSVFHGGGWHAILFAGTQLALTLPVCWINRAFFISGWKGIKTRAPGMDTLVALGAGASLAYGLFAIVMICVGLYTGNDDLVMQYRHDLYFESAAMILTLITVGKTLEAYSKGQDHRRAEKPDEAGPADRLCAARRRAGHSPCQRGPCRRLVPGPPR